MKKRLSTVVVALCSFSVFGSSRATLLDLPVSSVGNAAYLSSASSRPWWNKDWTRRAPILLSSEAKVLRPGAVVDVVVDFGEEVKPEDVRVVTMWETEVPCTAEKVKREGEGEERRTDTPVRSDGNDTSSKSNGQECPFSGTNGQECPFSGTNGQECPFSETAVRLLFRGDFRIEENKPFLVYWGRDGTDKSVRSPTGDGTDKSVRSPGMPPVEETSDEIVFRNGLVEVAFDKHVWAGGLIKRLRVPGSGTSSELLQRATGPAWNGFNIGFGNKPPVWSAPKVVTDNAFVKEVAFDCPQAEVRFALYAEQPRVDWSYRLKAAEGQVFLMNTFAVGGSTTHDKIFYPGALGKVLSLDASLDQATDCIPWPHFENLHKSLGDGWIAIADTRRSEVVGLVFDRPALDWMIYSGHFASGELVSMRFRHGGTDKSVRSPTGDGTDKSVRSPFASGAIVAAMGSWPRVREESDRLRGTIQVRVGAAESVREIPVRVPRLDRDWIADFNVGATPMQGHPLESGDWATNICNHLRSYGANTIKTGAWYVWDLPLTRGLYDAMTNAVAPAKRRPYPVWEEGKFTGRKLKEETSAAHAKGMAMSNWPDYMGGFWWVDREIRRADPVCRQIDRDVESLFADCGIDSVHNWQFGGEGLPLPKDVRNKHGEHYWKWPKEAKNGYFDSVGEQHRRSREFYADSKKRHPDLPVFVYTSENGEMLRDFMTTELAGHFDTLYVEMLPHGVFSETKHAAKRMRALFGNRAGHTVHHHFYFYDLTEAQRVCEVEQPFVYGINGFSVENLLYEQADIEYSEIIADFYRFMEYTRLGEKVARMAPVKDVAVFRDDRAFRQDVLENRVGKQYAQRAQQDARVRAFGEMPSFTYDVVINKYFTAKDLAQYKAVYIPEDDALSEECEKELLEYVRAGGGVVVEGVMGEKSKSKVEVEERRTDTPVRSEIEADSSTLRLRLGASTLTLKDGEVKSYGAGRIVWTKEALTDALAKRDRKAMARVKALLKSVGSEPPFVIEGSDCYGLDAVLQASDEGMFLGVINQGKEKQKGTVTLGERTLLSVRGGGRTDRSVRSPMFVLDVKAGVRIPFTNSFEVAVGGNQCAFYLIGDDAFTALPATRSGESRTAAVRSVAAKGELPNTAVDTNFTRVAAVEFVPLAKGKPVEIRRSRLAAIDVTSVTPESYDAAAVRKALKKATYVHFLGTAEKVDAVFADCAAELKAMLSRGGALLIDRSPVGPAGHAFLGSVGVFDASEGMLSGVGDTYAVWNESVSTNVPLHAARHAEIGNRWSLQYDKVYAKWDAPKQVAPLLARLDSTKAMVVYQENVCGTGKVIFNGNVRSFTDWYENEKYGDNILTWIIGTKTDEHAKKVEQLNGGLGNVVLE